LNQGTFHLLSLAGIAPQVHHCCRSQRPLIIEETNPHWRIGFSYPAGGIVLHQEEPVNDLLGSRELKLLQHLSQPTLPTGFSAEIAHLKTIEKLLRNYTEYHFHRSIRSASLVDTLLEQMASPLTPLDKEGMSNQ
jgi:DNA repair protein RecO (recombination protein O)